MWRLTPQSSEIFIQQNKCYDSVFISEIISSIRCNYSKLFNSHSSDISDIGFCVQVKHVMAERNVLIKNIQHPFLIHLHYSFQTREKLYFVLDYVNGGEVWLWYMSTNLRSPNLHGHCMTSEPKQVDRYASSSVRTLISLIRVWVQCFLGTRMLSSLLFNCTNHCLTSHIWLRKFASFLTKTNACIHSYVNNFINHP